LFSVFKAAEALPCEIFVVDNNSVDGSTTLIKEKFPHVILIENKINTGFSVANNQAIKLAKGEFVLLLNPDTVVQEDTFFKIINFMEQTPDAGGLGVKMLDGQGNFAPESKRGLPTPEVAFYKMFGFSKLFPKSKKFGKYHLSYLDENDIHSVDVLSGAFMLIRKSVLDKIGYLDETFFMYGEDIDLSYRITKSGFKNYYFPKTQIIHYKGESTKRSSLNYVIIFYNAMAIFSKKHFSGSNAFVFNILIRFAILLKATLALLVRLLKTFTVPMLDFLGIILGLFLTKQLYIQNAHLQTTTYSEKLVAFAFLSYAIIWMVSVYFNSGYDKPIKLFKIGRGILIGTLFILIAYALLPETIRFSRALILLGTIVAFMSMFVLRILLHLFKIKTYSLIDENVKRIAIVGEEDEFNRVHHLIKLTSVKTGFVGFVSIEKNNDHQPMFIGKFNQIDEIIKVHHINEIIFCAKDLSSQVIINSMLKLVSNRVSFKIAPPESFSIIGSNHIDTAGDLYMIDFNSISKPHNKRKKRLLDFFSALVILLLSPILFFIQDKKNNFFSNCFYVLIGRYSWVGFGKTKDQHLPEMKRSILSPTMLHDIEIENSKLFNLQYAKDYNVEKDMHIIWECIDKLGN
jgi:GT2 family glycosyltransferase